MVEATLETLRVDVAIIGAGFAGASTAYHLSRGFDGSILVIDKEKVPGHHASGRNASLVLQSVDQPDIRRAAHESRLFYEEHREELGFRQCGSLLVGARQDLEATRDPALLESHYLEPHEVRRRAPQLAAHAFDAGLYTPSDGVMDIGLLLHFYIARARARGVRFAFDCGLDAIERGPHGYSLRAGNRDIQACYLIDAAGAWAAEVRDMVRVPSASIPLAPLKRHLFVIDRVPAGHPGDPFVWSLAHEFYFRHESGGLLFSICDEIRCASLEPTVEPDMALALAQRVSQHLPALEQATVRTTWSCFRTWAPDRAFVIGWDPGLDDFFWVAGLGGHGMGTSWEVGRMAAARFLDRQAGAPAFSPERFAA